MLSGATKVDPSSDVGARHWVGLLCGKKLTARLSGVVLTIINVFGAKSSVNRQAIVVRFSQ